jgi:hypothetical protein
VDRHHVAVVESRQDLCFPMEALAEVGVIGGRTGDQLNDLDGDFPLEALVGRLENGSHSADSYRLF